MYHYIILRFYLEIVVLLACATIFMTFVVFIIEIISSLSLSVYILYSYGNIARHNPFVTICCLIVWFFSLIVVFLLPLDISSSFSNHCINSNISNISCHLSYSYLSPTPIRILWYILYWSLQILSWVILPIFQSYVNIHYFSIWKRIAWALVQNGIIFLSLALISIIIMLFLIIKEGWNFNNILSMAVTASNVWVLFFLILLLGYGLVEIPRYLFKIARYDSYLKYLYFQTGKTYFEKLESEVEMNDVEHELRFITQMINDNNDPMVKFIKIIIKKLPLPAQAQFSLNVESSNVNLDTENIISLHRLEKLHEKTILTTRKLVQNSAQLLQLLEKTVSLEKVVGMVENEEFFSDNKMMNSSVSIRPSSLYFRAKWFWQKYILRILYYFLFICSLFFSSLIFVSEITLFLNQFAKITLLSYFINISYLTNEYITSELFCIIILGYIALCAYYSVFQIRIFNKYRLVAQHNSNEFSLIFSAILLSRLITSMCLNFLYMVDLARLPSTSSRNVNIKPTFFDIWGSTVPEIAVLFFLYFPLVIIIVVISTMFHLDKRILSFCGFQQFIGDADLTSELVLEGKEYIKMERRIINKKDSEKLKREYNVQHKIKRNDPNDHKGCLIEKSSFRKDFISNVISYMPKRISTNSPIVKYHPLKSSSLNDFPDCSDPTLSSESQCDIVESKDCIISSDGGRVITNSNFDVPNREIFWDI